MPWDTQFESDPVDDQTPPELLELVERIRLDEDLRLESVGIGRKKKQGKAARPSGSYLKWSNYLVEHEEPEEICAIVIGGAYACAEVDGAAGVNKYQATVVWTVVATGKKDRDRVAFELDEAKARSSRAPLQCPGCAGLQRVADILQRQCSSLGRDLAAARNRADAERARADEAITAERSRQDKVAQHERDQRDKLAADMARVGMEAAKDARDAYRPTQESTAQILGMLAGAVDAYKGAIDARAQHAESLASDRAKAKNSELVGQSLQMINKLAMKIVASKFGSKDSDDDSDDNKKADQTAMDKLKKLRDDLFAKATDADWTTLEDGAGPDFVDTVKSMREGDVDLPKLDATLDRLAVEKSPQDLMAMLIKLSEPIQDIFMKLGDAVKAAKQETEAK